MKLDLHVHSKEGSDGRWPLDARASLRHHGKA